MTLPGADTMKAGIIGELCLRLRLERCFFNMVVALRSVCSMPSLILLTLIDMAEDVEGVRIEQLLELECESDLCRRMPSRFGSSLVILYRIITRQERSKKSWKYNERLVDVELVVAYAQSLFLTRH